METQGTMDCITNYVNMNVHEMDIPYTYSYGGSSSLAKPDLALACFTLWFWLRHTIWRYSGCIIYGLMHGTGIRYDKIV